MLRITLVFPDRRFRVLGAVAFYSGAGLFGLIGERDAHCSGRHQKVIGRRFQAPGR